MGGFLEEEIFTKSIVSCLVESSLPCKLERKLHIRAPRLSCLFHEFLWIIVNSWNVPRPRRLTLTFVKIFTSKNLLYGIDCSHSNSHNVDIFNNNFMVTWFRDSFVVIKLVWVNCWSSSSIFLVRIFTVKENDLLLRWTPLCDEHSPLDIRPQHAFSVLILKGTFAFHCNQTRFVDKQFKKF